MLTEEAIALNVPTSYSAYHSVLIGVIVVGLFFGTAWLVRKYKMTRRDTKQK